MNVRALAMVLVFLGSGFAIASAIYVLKGDTQTFVILQILFFICLLGLIAIPRQP